MDPCLLLPEPLYLNLCDPNLESGQVPSHAHRIQYHYSTDELVSESQSSLGSLSEYLDDAPLDSALPFLQSEVVIALGWQDLVHEVVPGAQGKVKKATLVVGGAKFHRMLVVYGVHARVENGFPCLNYKFSPSEIFRQIIQRLFRLSSTNTDFLS